MTRALASLLLIAFAAPAWALDYLSVAEAAALYDTPSQKGRPLFAIAPGTPVEAVVNLDGWVKVRDARGELAWIEKRYLAQKRTVIVRAERAQVRSQPDDKATIAFEAEKDVVLEWVEAGPLGWAQVRHRDGQGGFVRAAQVWGL